MKLPGQIIKKVKRRKNLRPAWSKEKESQYKDLVARLEALGFTVRREELKRGHCWKVQSGSCRSLTQRLVFVDSRLSPDDQVAFLGTKLNEATAQLASTPAVPQAA